MNDEKNIKLRILLLGENILEALEHISKLVENGDGEHTLDLMTDVLEGFQSIEEAIVTVGNANTEEMVVLTSRLRNTFNLLVKAYEQNDEIGIDEILKNNVLPDYRSWLNYINNILNSDGVLTSSEY